MRNRIVVMLAMLAVAGIMAAMAYTRAEVRNPASATIVRTDVALLALDCAPDGVGYKDENCRVDKDGRLHLDFARGLAEEGTPGTPGTHWVTGPEPGEIYGFSSSTNGDGTISLTYKTQDGRSATLTVPDSSSKSFSGTTNGCHTSVIGSNTIKICHLSDIKDGPGAPGKPGTYGFQPGSTYNFGNLVRVTNNSEDAVNVSVALPSDWMTSGFDVAVASGSIDLTAPHSIRLASGDSTWISFAFTVPDEWATATGNFFPTGAERYPFSGMLVVNAEATP